VLHISAVHLGVRISKLNLLIYLSTLSHNINTYKLYGTLDSSDRATQELNYLHYGLSKLQK
jgi:hypothetical protein